MIEVTFNVNSSETLPYYAASRSFFIDIKEWFAYFLSFTRNINFESVSVIDSDKKDILEVKAGFRLRDCAIY